MSSDINSLALKIDSSEAETDVNKMPTENVQAENLESAESKPTNTVNVLESDLGKPIRLVRSHPSLGGRASLPATSLGSLAMTRSVKSNFQKTGMAVVPVGVSQRQQKTSQESVGRQKSPQEEKQPRQTTPDEEEEEEGNHDTITSLAGAKMMQWYHKAITGSRKNSNGSLNQQQRLEDLFLIEEDVKREEEREGDREGGEAEASKDPAAEKLLSEDSEELVEETDIFVPPDGGYGWFVALGAFIALMWTAGLVKSYGVIFERILDEFPSASVTLASWIPASMTTLSLALAPVASALCSRYNCRTVTFAGAFFCTLGICLSGFATSIEFLFVTFGLLTGIGMGMSTTPGVILVARYFNKRRGVANAFCLSGTATGSFLLPFFIEYLLDEYGFRGGLCILGGCLLHLCLSAALYRPLHVHARMMRMERLEMERKENNLAENAHVPLNERPVENTALFRNASEPQLAKNNSHPQLVHYYQGHMNNQHPILYRHPSDPNDVVCRLQTRLHQLASNSSAETVSLYSDKDPATAPSMSDLQSPPNTPNLNGRSQSCRRYSQQTSTQQNSSYVSREDLECNWSASHPSISDTPRLTESHDIVTPCGDAIHRNGYRHDSYCQHYTDIPVVSKAKALSLHELYMRQLSSRISNCRMSFFGEKPLSFSGKKSAEAIQDCQHKGVRNVDSFSSVGSALSGAQPQTQPPAKTAQSKKLRRKSSFMFSCEDLMTDSTCALKDHRYPTVRVKRPFHEVEPDDSDDEDRGRIVTLGRSVSVVSRRGRSEQARRIRYPSERRSRSECGSIFDLPLFGSPPPTRVASFSSSHAGSKRRKTNASAVVQIEKKDKDETESEKLKQEEVPEKPEVKDDDTESESSQHPVKSCLMCVHQLLGLSLCSDPRFVIVVLSVMCMSFGVPHVLFFLPSYTHHLHVGVDPAILLATISLSDLLGRVIFGFLADREIFPKYTIYAMLIFLAGFSISLLPLFKSAPALFIILSFYGIGGGGWFLMVPVLLADFFGVEKIGASYGLVRLFQSGSNLVAPIIGGFIRDQSGSFSEAYFFMGGVMIIGCPIVLLTPLLYKEKSTEPDPESQKDEKK